MNNPRRLKGRTAHIELGRMGYGYHWNCRGKDRWRNIARAMRMMEGKGDFRQRLLRALKKWEEQDAPKN